MQVACPQCSGRLEVDARRSPPIVACPHCGGHVQLPTIAATAQQPAYQPPPAHLQPPATNGLGIAGFIVSLVGIVTCGLLAPIGLLLSLVALLKQPRGFAVAGSVIGALGSVLLVVVGLAFFGAILGVRAVAGEALEMARLAFAGAAVQAHFQEYGTLPTAEEGKALVDQFREGGPEIRYTPLDAERFEVRTAGDDGQFDTADDRNMELNAREAPPGAGGDDFEFD